MTIKFSRLAFAALMISAAPAWSQAHGGSAGHAQHQQTPPKSTSPAEKAMDNSMPGMDHGKMKMSDTPFPANSDSMPGMDHGAMNHGSMDGKPKTGQPEKAPEMTGMDHGDMNAQGGPAPADARDPHGYSGGYTLDKGPYTTPGTPRLRLADEHKFATVLIDRLERGYGKNNNDTVYDGQAWFGTAYDRLVVKAEGDVAKGKLQEARTELLWGHAIATFWDVQAGIRHDSGVGPDRSWLALGVQGLAPYWFEVDAAAYIGENGRTAARLEAEYELLLTQRLILQPRVEINYYGKSDPALEIGSGLSSGSIGLRLRYEINRQFAPYIGVERVSKFGKTADIARADGALTEETRWVAGVRIWF